MHHSAATGSDSRRVISTVASVCEMLVWSVVRSLLGLPHNQLRLLVDVADNLKIIPIR